MKTVTTVLAVIILIALVGFVVTSPAPFPARTQPPTSLLIGGVIWEVIERPVVKGNPNVLGYTECANKVMLIKKSEDEHEALLHEIMHAAVCLDAGKDFDVNNMYWATPENDGHESIYRAASFFATTFRNNPSLVAYIGSK